SPCGSRWPTGRDTIVAPPLASRPPARGFPAVPAAGTGDARGDGMNNTSLRLLVPCLAALVLLPGTGCIAPLQACTDEARSSVGVSVVDENHAPVTDATLTYSVDGGPEKD